MVETYSLLGVLTNSIAIDITLDTVAPTLAASLTTDSGTSAVDGLTNDPTVGGTAEVGATLTIKDGSTTLGTVVVGAGGSWTYTPTGLAQGAHTLDITGADLAGNTTVAHVSFTLDTVAPSKPTRPLVDPTADTGALADGHTADITPTLTGTADPGSLVVLKDGATTLGSPTLTVGNTWTIDSSILSHGLHSLTVTAIDAAGNVSVASDPLALTIDTALGRDFAGSGHDAILFRATDGTEWQWQTNGSTVTAQGGGMVDLAWSIAGTGDFNGDGRADILWHKADGNTYIWEMNGTTIIGQGGPGLVDPAWSIIAVADFTGEGYSDILWRHAGDNALWLFQMNGTTNTGGGPIANLPGAPWSVVGAADLTGNGKADIIWQNATSGEFYAWSMNGVNLLAQGTLGNGGGTTPTDWHLAGTGDFNHDGIVDQLDLADLLGASLYDGGNYLPSSEAPAVAAGSAVSPSDAAFAAIASESQVGTGRKKSVFAVI